MLDPITRQEKILSGEDLEPITRQEWFLKKYRGGGSGGTSIDVTAEVGQTIIVKEVDADGKPTKWKAADYQEKICGMIEKAFLETTEAAFVQDPESGLYIATVASDNTIEENVVYRVKFNGVTYENTYNAEMNCIGNLGLLGAGEDTGEPYIMAFVEGAINILSIVEIASATVGIVYSLAQPFDEKWLPDIPFYDITNEGPIKTGNNEVAQTAEFISFFDSVIKRGIGRLKAYLPERFATQGENSILAEVVVTPISFYGDKKLTFYYLENDVLHVGTIQKDYNDGVASVTVSTYI